MQVTSTSQQTLILQQNAKKKKSPQFKAKQWTDKL